MRLPGGREVRYGVCSTLRTYRFAVVALLSYLFLEHDRLKLVGSFVVPVVGLRVGRQTRKRQCTVINYRDIAIECRELCSGSRELTIQPPRLVYV